VKNLTGTAFRFESITAGCGSGHCWGRNGESCVGPVTRTAGILGCSGLKALAVNGAGHPTDIGHMLA